MGSISHYMYWGRNTLNTQSCTPTDVPVTEGPPTLYMELPGNFKVFQLHRFKFNDALIQWVVKSCAVNLDGPPVTGTPVH